MARHRNTFKTFAIVTILNFVASLPPIVLAAAEHSDHQNEASNISDTPAHQSHITVEYGFVWTKAAKPTPREFLFSQLRRARVLIVRVLLLWRTPIMAVIDVLPYAARSREVGRYAINKIWGAVSVKTAREESEICNTIAMRKILKTIS
ncbi:hypothetical protein E2C01_094513 [Portunus trituberculatus]|uniref:Uncharacterized protein n=1 Tax=Portunus trituberculatus TaxID=210409 RepID=A0A5B7K0W5_PORTR|nr:hypothetical protein [Portunus trituberculatus]